MLQFGGVKSHSLFFTTILSANLIDAYILYRISDIHSYNYQLCFTLFGINNYVILVHVLRFYNSNNHH